MDTATENATTQPKNGTPVVASPAKRSPMPKPSVSPAAEEAVRHLPLSKIDPSPLNPYKELGDLASLAESIRTSGVLEPVIVRPKGDRFELVCGHRRTAAAKLAKRDTIPAIVRELADDQVLVDQILENSERRGDDPLSEGEGYKLLHEKFGHSADAIAEKVGKSRRTVYTRMALARLVPDAKKALREGRITPSHGLLVARVIGEEAQKKLLKEITFGGRGDAWQGSVMPYAHAVKLVQDHYMIDLRKAPFPLADALLVAKAGACTSCPKRAGNNRELYADTKNDDTCTDGACYRAKLDALWAQRVKETKAEGKQILSDDKAKRVFNDYDGTVGYGASFVDLDAKNYNDLKHRTWRAALGELAAKHVVVARDHGGQIRELFPKAALPKKFETSSRSSYGYSSDSSWAKEQARRKKAMQGRAEVARRALTQVVAKAERGATSAEFWRFVVRCLFGGGYHDVIELAVKRRELASAAVLKKSIETMTEGQLRGLCVELLAGADAAGGFYSYGFGSEFLAACKFYGVDHKTIERQVAAEARAKAKAKKKSTKKGASHGAKAKR